MAATILTHSEARPIPKPTGRPHAAGCIIAQPNMSPVLDYRLLLIPGRTYQPHHIPLNPIRVTIRVNPLSAALPSPLGPCTIRACERSRGVHSRIAKVPFIEGQLAPLRPPIGARGYRCLGYPSGRTLPIRGVGKPEQLPITPVKSRRLLPTVTLSWRDGIEGPAQYPRKPPVTHKGGELRAFERYWLGACETEALCAILRFSVSEADPNHALPKGPGRLAIWPGRSFITDIVPNNSDY
jgi:hypothetical protein